MAKTKAEGANSGGNDYWSKLSDEQLLSIKFTTDDPESLEDLVLDVPQTDKVIIEYAYDFRGSKRPYIRCAHCKYPNHLAGFVIKTDDGHRFLAGHDCGEKIYGANFEAFRKDYDAARNRAGNLRRMRNMHAALPAFLEYLGKLKRDPAFALYQKTRHEIRTKTPRLYGALQQATERQDGALFIEEKVRDYAAETRDEERYEREMEEWNRETVTERKKLRREGYEPAKPRKPLYTTVSTRIGTVSTAHLFSAQTNPMQVIHDVAAQFDNLVRGPAISEQDAQRLFAWQGRKDASPMNRLVRLSLTVGDMATMFTQVGALLDRIEEQIDRLAQLQSFFQPATLGPVAQWATARDLAGSYKATLSSLIFTNSDAEELIIQLPNTYRVPSKAGITTFRDAMNKY